MAKYKCTHVTVPGNKKCTRQPDGYARVGGKDFLMCKSTQMRTVIAYDHLTRKSFKS